jgi:hypothetical protein
MRNALGHRLAIATCRTVPFTSAKVTFGEHRRRGAIMFSLGSTKPVGLNDAGRYPLHKQTFGRRAA